MDGVIEAVSESKSSSGVGFVGLLQLMFIGLKLCNQVQWSWWLVFSPFLSVVALLALLFGFCFAKVK